MNFTIWILKIIVEFSSLFQIYLCCISWLPFFLPLSSSPIKFSVFSIRWQWYPLILGCATFYIASFPNSFFKNIILSSSFFVVNFLKIGEATMFFLSLPPCFFLSFSLSLSAILHPWVSFYIVLPSLTHCCLVQRAERVLSSWRCL